MGSSIQELYWVGPQDPGDTVWGIYRQRDPAGLFLLVTMNSSYNDAIIRAKALQGTPVEGTRFAIHGARNADILPDRMKSFPI